MTQLTGDYLERLQFHESHNINHNYRTEYSRYDSNVENGISLVSCTNAVDNLRGIEDERFEVWFYGRLFNATNNSYGEINSHIVISSVEELETLLNMIEWESNVGL